MKGSFLRSSSWILVPTMVALACGSGQDGDGQRGELQAVSAPDGTAGPLQIEYLGHASFLVRSPGGSEILLDPYQSRVWISYDFPEGISPDAVVITHPHYDHDAGRFRGAPFPWPDAVVVDAPGRVAVGDVTVTGIEGKHADPYGKEFGQLNTIMVLKVAGLRLAHVGDNGPISPQALNELGEVDILFMPMDSAYHILSPSETAEMRESVPHRILVPMHYRLPELEPVADRPDDLGPIAPVLEGEPSVRWLDSNVLRIGPDDVPDETEVVVFRHSPLIPVPGPPGS